MPPAGSRRAAAILVFAAFAPAARAAPPPLAWGVVEREAPRVFWADRNRDIRVRLRNLGSASWSEATGDHLAYHWLRRDGTVILFDGARAGFPGTVPPGATVDVVARVRAPDAAGPAILEWAMVREQVAWYEPPTSGSPTRVSVLVVRRCALLEVAFALGTLALVAAARRRPATGPRRWLLVEGVPVVWTWLGVGLATTTFSEVAHQQLWRGGGVLAAAAAALPAAAVAAMPGRWRAWAAGVLVAGANLVAVADAVHMRYFGTVVPLVALSAVRQVGTIGESIHALLRPLDGWLFVGAAGGILLAAAWPRRPRAVTLPVGSRRAVRAGLVVATLAAGVPALSALRSGLNDPATADQLFSHGALLGRWGFVNVHLFDGLRTYREWAARRSPDRGVEEAARAFFAARAASRARGSEAFGAARGANLILIQVESLQQWVIGARVGGVEITPFLNALRSRALYFPDVFDQTGQGRSSDGEFVVLNSQHALDRGAVAFRRAGDDFVALPGVLRGHGYATLSAHGFEKGFWNRGVLHPRYGFERMLFRDELGPGEVIGWGLADGVFFDRMVAPLAKERRPYFAFLITLGLHHPFDLFPDRHKVLDVGPLRGTPLGNYVHAMHYFDASLAGFLARLDETRALSDTVVALYGDHESGLALDPPLLALAGEPRWEPSLPVRLRRVPLFVLVPGGRVSGEVATVGGQLDVAPTLLSLLGLPSPTCFAGRPLGRDAAPWAVLNDGSVVAGDRLFVAGGPGVPPEGACFAFPQATPRPAGDCRDIARGGRDELAASRLVVLDDLAARFAAPSSP